MSSIESLTTFFGWCSVINIVFLLGLLLRGFVVRKLAARVFGVSEEEVRTTYMNLFVQFRSATLVLSNTPNIALIIMA
jgi:hypothetical protein